MSNGNYFRFKGILLGEGAVGKTSLLFRFVDNKFRDNYSPTLGVDFLSKEVGFSRDTVKVTIWDLAGQEKFKFMRKNFYMGANGALLIFDLTRPETFEKVSAWYEEMRENLSEEIPFLLIGNKADLINEGERVVEKEKAIEFAKNHQSEYIETSAKTGKNVEESFRRLLVTIAAHKNEELK